MVITVSIMGEILPLTPFMLHSVYVTQPLVLIKMAFLAGAKVYSIIRLLGKALFLPDASDYIASSPAETISFVKSVNDSLFVRGIQDEAKAHSLAINVGIHEPTSLVRRSRIQACGLMRQGTSRSDIGRSIYLTSR
jgi:hypothetical protein